MRILKNWMESYMEYNSTSEAPDKFMYWSGLWALSAAIGRKSWMRFRYGYIYNNLWIVLIGPAGTFKSTACNIAKGFLKDIKKVHVGPKKTTIEALIKFLPMAQESFVYQDEEHFHQSLALAIPDWTVLTGLQDLDKCNVMCDLYDADEDFDKWTTTQGCNFLKNFYISLFAGSTPEQIIKCIPLSAIGTGFTSRHLFIAGDPKTAEEDLNYLIEPSSEWNTLEEELKKDLEVISENIVGLFKRSKEADKWLNEWYSYNKKPKNRIIVDKNFDGYYNRKPTFLHQIAMLINASYSDSMEVQLEDYKKALKLLDQSEFRMPEAFSGFGTNPAASSIAIIQGAFKKHQTNELTFIQLGLEIWKQVGESQLKEAVNTMRRYGLAEVSKDKKSLILLGGK